jgi:hypothetical protein
MMNLVRRASVGLLALACLLVAARPAQAQLATVTVRSLDAVMEDAKYVLEMAGQGETAKQLDGIIAAFTGGKGFQGIDMKRPLGFYVDMPKDGAIEPPVVFFVPTTKNADLIDLLKALNIPVGEPMKGIHLVDLPNGQSLFLKFDNEYAYFTNQKDRLEAKLPNPAGFINAQHRSALLVAAVRFDAIPQEEKKKFLQQLDGMLKQGQERKPDESEATYQGRLAGMAFAKAVVTTLVEDAKDLTLALNIDKTKHIIDVDVALTPKIGSPLAQRFRTFGTTRSMFSGWAADSAMNILVALPIADDLRKELTKVVETAFRAALKEETDPKQKALAEHIYKTLSPSLQSDTFDFGVAIHGPKQDKLYSMVMGLKVKDGKKIEGLLKDIAKELPQGQRDTLKIDHDRVGPHSLHLIKPPSEDENLKKHLGSTDVYLLFRDDVVLLGIGKHAKEAMLDALNKIDRGIVFGTAPMQVEMSFRRLAALAPENAEKIAEVIKKIFTGEDSDKDKVRITLTGGDSLRLRLEFSALLIKAAASVAGQE